VYACCQQCCRLLSYHTTHSTTFITKFLLILFSLTFDKPCTAQFIIILQTFYSMNNQQHLGSSARELLLELKRGSGGDATAADSKNYVLPAYNDVLVRTCIDDMNGHMNVMADIAAQTKIEKEQRNRDGRSSLASKPADLRPSLFLHEAAFYRHKRCLLTYHQVRLNSIQDMYWQQGGQQGNVNENLSPMEQEFQQNYHKLIQTYCDGVDLDLHALSAPPLPQDRVQVRVLRDDVFGKDRTIALDSGTFVTFSKGSTHFLLFSDVEEYLHQGYLELLEGEEQGM